MPKLGVPNITFIGIDPGASGGIAWQRGNVVSAIKMPTTMKDLWDFFYDEFDSASAPCNGECHCIIEKVQGFVGKAQPGSAAFTFGKGYGSLLMALTGNQIPYQEVPPRNWQKALGVPPKKKEESKTQWKNRLKAVAQARFPKVPVTLNIADALLIMLYGQLQYGRKL